MRQELGRGLTLACAVSCGALVANLYYAQPLTAEIGGALKLAAGARGLVTTVTMVGYAAGLLLIVPLADKLENRRLILAAVLFSLLGLVGIGLAPSPQLFIAATLVTGFFSAGAQVVVPFAAALVTEERRGRAIGDVMAGLLAGIMLARPVASVVESLLGWRAVFLLAAGAGSMLWLWLLLVLPKRRPEGRETYGALLGSLFRLLASEALRRRAVYQGLAFAAFNVFWTAAPLELASGFHMGQQKIALFALAGAGGALAAPVAGRLGDRGHVRAGTGFALLALSLCLFAAGAAAEGGGVLLLAVLAVALDAATQLNQVLGQRVVYGIDPARRGRVNALYMTLVFLIGSGGAAAGAFAFHLGGFPAAAGLAGALAFAAFAYFLTEALNARTRAETAAAEPVVGGAGPRA